MGDETRVGLGGDPVVDRGFVAPGGRSRPGDNVQSPPGSVRIQPEAHSQHPTRTRMSRRQLHGERPEQSLSATTVTDTSHDPKHERITPVDVAVARRHPQGTHARATQLWMYTCAHRRWPSWTWRGAPWRGSTAGFCAISIAMSGGRMVRVPVAGRCGRRGGATATLPGRRWGERSRPSSSTNSEPSSARMTAPYSALRSSDDLSGDLDARERRLTDRERVLRAGEQRLRTEERLFRAERAPLASTSKIGRKERCPCGSGLKYKHCHGHTGAASCQRAHHQRVERKSSRDSSTRSPR